MAIRPARQQPKPLSALGSLLGVRLASVGKSFSPNDLGFVTGVTLDSRVVVPGDLYVALPGTKVHGAAFCADAVAAGAVAVLTDPDGRARAAPPGYRSSCSPIRAASWARSPAGCTGTRRAGCGSSA